MIFFEGMVTSCDLDFKETHEIIDKVSRNVSISCFIETWNNMLMYAHYTDSFKGFCLEYNFSYAFAFPDFPLLYFFPVIYKNKPSNLARMR